MTANLNEPDRLREQRYAEWMEKSKAGDSAAFKELLMEVSVQLRNYHTRGLRRMGVVDRARVDDLVQESLLAIHAKRHTYDSQYPFGAWMYAIARYKLIDLGRKLKRETLLVGDMAELDLMLGAGQDLSEGSEQTKRQELDQMLATLSTEQRSILEMVKLQGLSVAEVCSKTGKSPSAVKVTVHRALKILKGLKEAQ